MSRLLKEERSHIQNKEVEQDLVDLEYYFSQYFKENCVRVVDGVLKEVESNREREAVAIRKDFGNPWIAGKPGVADVAENAVSRGKWNSKGVTDVLLMCDEKMYKNPQFVRDYTLMVAAYRSSLVSVLGAERYKSLSERVEGGDLAAAYVQMRFQRMTVDRLVRQGEIPRSSLEYVCTKGSQDNLVGVFAFMLPDALRKGVKDNSAVTDLLGYEDMEACVRDYYRPSTGEEVASTTIGFLCDTGTGVNNNPVSAGIDVMVRGGCLIHDLSEDTRPAERTYDQDFSKEVFGRSDTVDRLRQAGVSSLSVSSRKLYHLNQSMSHPVQGVRDSSVMLDSSESKRSVEGLFQQAGNDGHAVLEVAEAFVGAGGFSVKKDKPVPGWMMRGDLSFCAHNSAYYFGLADEMRLKGSGQVKVGKNILTLDQVVQRGYDYARAAESKQLKMDAAYRQQLDEYHEQIRQNELTLSALSKEQERQQQEDVRARQASLQLSSAAKQKDVAGWGDWLDALGLGGFGEVGRNFGYVAKMLPDLLAGLFTGKLKGTSLRDNIFPIAAIMMGFFVKNPLLRLLLIGLGGANLLNKLGHEALGQAKGSSVALPYRQYDDEALDGRMTKPAMKGNTLVAEIDGVPHVITVSGEAADAYHQGKLPLNTLCNAVLKKFDSQQNELSARYEQQLADNPSRGLSKGLR